MSAVRLLAVDLDFTLLDSDRSIPPDSAEAVNIALAAGIQVVLASGRVASGMLQYAEELGLDTPLISCNGAYVVSRYGRVITESRLPAAIVQRALRFFWDNGVHAHIYKDNEILIPESNAWTEIYLGRVRRAEHRVATREEMLASSAHKVIAMAAPSQAKDLSLEAAAIFADKGVSVVRSEPEYLELIGSSSDKGTGLAAVAGHLGVLRSQTAAIGDYHNDIPMLRWAAFSAAVANAPPEVQAEADRIVARHDSGGVHEFVRFLVHNSEQSNRAAVRP